MMDAAALFHRFQQILNRKDKIDLMEFKKKPSLFVDTIVEVFSVPDLKELKENPSTPKEKEGNIKTAIRFLQMVDIDTHNIKVEHVLNGQPIVKDVLMEVFLHYLDRKLQTKNVSSEEGNPTQMFLSWINDRLRPDHEVYNFHSNWNEGMALAVLIESFVPGSCPNWRHYTVASKDTTIKRLMEIALQSLGISKIIQPNEMASSTPESQSIVIYLSQFLDLRNEIEPPKRAVNPDRKVKTMSVPKQHLTTSEEPKSKSQLSQRLPLKHKRYKPSYSTQDFWRQMDKNNVKYDEHLKKLLDEIEMKIGFEPFWEDAKFAVVKARIRLSGDLQICAAKYPVANDLETIQSFLKEVFNLTILKHENIIPLKSFVLSNGRPHIVFPLYKHGDLRTYLHRYPSDSQQKLLGMAVDIAMAMEFLHKKDFICGNLQARNCFVDDDLSIVLANLENVQDLIEETPETDPEAWKLQAPEISMQNNRLSKASDVWSFGLVLYEIYSCGKELFENIRSVEQLHDELRNFHTVPQPVSCPDKVYCIMKECLDKRPEGRPSFSQLIRRMNPSHKRTQFP